MDFNEPEHAEQVNLSPEAACVAWNNSIYPIASSHPGVIMIGPSVTNSGAPTMGLSWLSTCYNVCPYAVVHAQLTIRSDE
jgi:hypothetical protein